MNSFWVQGTPTSTTWTTSFHFERGGWKEVPEPRAVCATCGHPVPDRDVVEHVDFHAAATLAAP